MARVAINGFGRIGRLFFRRVLEINDPSFEIVAINDLTDAKTLAHLLKYDSTHGKLHADVSYGENCLIVNGKKIPIYAVKNPQELPWKKERVDVVIESTGRFVAKDKASLHLLAGAKKVLISAPAKGSDVKTVVYNINHHTITASDTIVSAASCTTNCLVPLAYYLNKHYGIKWGLMTTVHAYTADQKLQDAPHSDLRRARAAAVSIIPTSTGAAKAIGLVLPELNGKMHGIALRVPTVSGSIVDLTVELEKETSLEQIHKMLKAHANESFAYLEDPIVSVDVIGSTHGSLFDPSLSIELVQNNKKIYKLFVWYDNETSYVSQLTRVARYLVTLNKF